MVRLNLFAVSAAVVSMSAAAVPSLLKWKKSRDDARAEFVYKLTKSFANKTPADYYLVHPKDVWLAIETLKVVHDNPVDIVVPSRRPERYGLTVVNKDECATLVKDKVGGGWTMHDSVSAGGKSFGWFS